MKKTIKTIGCVAMLATAIISCNKDESTSSTDSTQAVSKSAVIENYANIVFANYEDAIADAKVLRTAINNFTADPTADKFQAAKDAWLVSRESYGTTEAFRFANGPIDADDGPEGLLNAWPLDELYIDYVSGAPDAGIINDVTVTIDAATLEGLNEGQGIESNVSVGYHAIEFLLWGQDLTAPAAKQAGLRPYTDFVDGGTAANQDRRRMYLQVCGELLVNHLQLMIDTWKEGGAYRTEFLAMNEDVVLKNMIASIAELAKGELSGERIKVAYTNQDQEDEHSCFSDNTHRDARLNLEGIANVYTGKYKSISGASLEQLVTQTNPTIGAAVTAQLNVAIQAVDATGIPFDFAITDAAERPKVQLAANALDALGDKLVEGEVALGL